MLTGVLNLANPVNASAPLNRGLVSSWTAINQGPYFGGARFLDLLGKNHGTFAGGNLAGWSGLSRPSGYGSIAPAASSSYINCGSPTNLQFTTNVSLGAWVRFTTARDFAMAAGYCEDSGATAGYGIIYLGGSIRFFVNSYPNAATIAFSADGLWHHVVGTYDSSLVSNNAQIYLDGVPGTALNFTTSLTYGGTSRMQISAAGSGFATWPGNLDDVRVSNRTLSASEVLALYAASRTGYRNELNWLRRGFAVVPAGGGTTVSGAGSSSLTFSATAAGAASVAGVGSATLTFAGSGTAASTAAGAGTPTLTFTPAATGAASAATAGTSSLTFTPAGTGAATAAASGTSSLTFIAVSTDTPVHAGSGTSSLAFTTAGTLNATTSAAGTPSLTFSASGGFAATAAGASTITLNFSATGTTPALAADTGPRVYGAEAAVMF